MKKIKPLTVINFRIDEHTATMLKILAEEQERTISNLVRKYLHEGIMRDSKTRQEAK